MIYALTGIWKLLIQNILSSKTQAKSTILQALKYIPFIINKFNAFMLVPR
jgi:hypothetical protein